MLTSKAVLFPTEIQHLIAFALEDAWQELKTDALAVHPSVKERLASTMVELAADGETDPLKLKRVALHVIRERRGALSCRERGSTAGGSSWNRRQKGVETAGAESN